MKTSQKEQREVFFLFIVVYIEFPKVFVIFFPFTSHEEKQPYILVEP